MLLRRVFAWFYTLDVILCVASCYVTLLGGGRIITEYLVPRSSHTHTPHVISPQTKAGSWCGLGYHISSCLIRCLPWRLSRAKHMSSRRTSFQNPACRFRLCRGLLASPCPDIPDSRHAFWHRSDSGHLEPSPPTIRHLSAPPGSALHRQAGILGIRLKGRGRGVNWVTGARETLGDMTTSRLPSFVRHRPPICSRSVVARERIAPHIHDRELSMHLLSESGIAWSSSTYNHIRKRKQHTHTKLG